MSEPRVEYQVAMTEPAEVAIPIPLGRPWRCASGQHVLGQVIREKGIRRLHLAEGHVITGHALIFCPECAQLREWHSGADGISELLSRRGTTR